MASGNWNRVVPLMEASNSLGHFLVSFSALAANQARSAAYQFEVEGNTALWKLARPKGASVNSAQADAVAVGFFC